MAQASIHLSFISCLLGPSGAKGNRAWAGEGRGEAILNTGCGRSVLGHPPWSEHSLGQLYPLCSQYLALVLEGGQAKPGLQGPWPSSLEVHWLSIGCGLPRQVAQAPLSAHNPF